MSNVVTMIYFYDFRCRQGELFDYLTQVVTLSEKRTRYVSSSETNHPTHCSFPYSFISYKRKYALVINCLGLNEIYVWFLLPTYPNFFNPTLNIKMVFGEKNLKWARFQILSLFSLLNVITNLIISLPTYPKFCWYATGTTHLFHLGLSQACPGELTAFALTGV